MRVLVTGAAGFIGSHLTGALLARGDEVLGLDSLNEFYDPAIKERNLDLFRDDDRFEFVRGDIRDRETVASVFRDRSPEAVVHLAAMAGVRPSIRQPALYADVNVTGTAILLEEAVRAGTGRFVFASSSSVYGERSDPPFLETDRVDRPVSPYAATKKAGELLCHTIHAVSDLSMTCLRYFTVYGPRQRPEMAIHRFTRRITQGRPIPVYGDGSMARDFTYVDDIVDGTVRAIDRCGEYRIYNLGGSHVTRLSELIEILADVLGTEPVIDRQPVPPGDVPLLSASVELAERELGWQPRVDIRTGIGRFVDWYRADGNRAGGNRGAES